MTYSVYQHWDPLKVCIVGKSYSPEFYNYITNSKVRNVMERIAYETEEDYQKLIKLLESFGVEVLRPTVHDNHENYLINNKIAPPPMTPCDWSIMIGDTFYHNWQSEIQIYNDIKDYSWPTVTSMNEFNSLDINKKQEVYESSSTLLNVHAYTHILEKLAQNGNTVIEKPVQQGGASLNRAMISRIGKDLYIGTPESGDFKVSKDVGDYLQKYKKYRTHIVDSKGHGDGTYCPVVPGLIVSLKDIPTYKDTFPGWEVIYLPNQSWSKVRPFLKLKQKNKGKWWVPGEELNNDFTDFVESWLGHWVGYVEETVFDVNMLVIDEKNVVCNNYNEAVFKAFDRYGITPHVVNFRHRYFWDGGLHCITSDIHREGTLKDYFPERG